MKISLTNKVLAALCAVLGLWVWISYATRPKVVSEVTKIDTVWVKKDTIIYIHDVKYQVLSRVDTVYLKDTVVRVDTVNKTVLVPIYASLTTGTANDIDYSIWHTGFHSTIDSVRLVSKYPIVRENTIKTVTEKQKGYWYVAAKYKYSLDDTHGIDVNTGWNQPIRNISLAPQVGVYSNVLSKDYKLVPYVGLSVSLKIK